MELERELKWRRATRTAFVELYQRAGLRRREAELAAAVQALHLASAPPGPGRPHGQARLLLTFIGRRKLEPLLDRIADALRRHHEMLAEMELLAEEFQDQVKAMRMMDSKLQRHMQRLDKDGWCGGGAAAQGGAATRGEAATRWKSAALPERRTAAQGGVSSEQPARRGFSFKQSPLRCA